MIPFNFLSLFGSGITRVFLIVMLAILAVIIVPNLGQIYTKLGFDTVSSMKDKVSKAEEGKVKAMEAAKVSDSTITVLSNVDKAKDEVVVKTDEEVKVINVKTKNRISSKDKNVNDIKNQPNLDTKEISPELKLAVKLSGESLEKVRISQVNISSIWDSYCSVNKQCEEKS